MHIFFATPTYKGVTDDNFLNSLEATVEACKARGWETSFNLVHGCCYVQEARNNIVHEFLKSGADVLFFLDDDLGWDVAAALKLIEMEDDVVGGTYPLKCEPLNFPVVIFTDPNDRPIVRGDGCIAANGLPTGFLRVKRLVIEMMIAAYPEYEYEEYDAQGELKAVKHDLFPQGVHRRRWVGEDYAFCRLWTELRGQLWLVPDIDFVHNGYVGNYHEYLLRQPGGSKHKELTDEKSQEKRTK